MIRRSSRILLEVVAGVAGVLVLLGVAAAWRLARGPVSLAFAVPYVHEQLAKAGGPLAFRLDDIIVAWGGWERTLDIRVLGVTARNRGGVVVAAVPEMSVSLALVALARGEIAPTRLELIAPVLRARRTESGDFELALGRRAGPSGEILPLLFQALLDPPDHRSPFAALTRISIVGGDLTVDDRKLATTWRAPRLDVVLVRDDAGIGARFSLEAALDGHAPRLSGEARYDAGAGTIEVEGKLEGVRPDRLATQIAALAPLRGVALPVDAAFRIRLTGDGVPLAGSYRLSAGPGVLEFPGLVPRTVPVRRATARGSFDVEASRVVLDEATLDLGGPTIGLSGVAALVDGVATVSAEAVARKIPLADLKSYWPRTANPVLRGWITDNLADGGIDEARAKLRARSTRSGRWSIDGFDARLRIAGVTVRYLDPLIPVRKVAGTIIIAPGRVDIAIDGGDLNGLDVDTATIEIVDDGSDNWNLALAVVLRGALREALEVLDHPKLGYAAGLGIDVARVAGRTAIRLRVALPLSADVGLDEVDIRAAASLAEIDVPGVAFGHDVRDGALTLQVDKSGMTVSGTATLAGIPASIEWYENFGDDAPFVRRYALKATLDDDGRARLGLDTAPYLAGKVAADIVLIERADATSELVGRFTLDQARLALAPFGWSKPAATPGQARIEIAFAGGRITEVSRFDIRAPGLVANGAITFDDDGRTIRRAEFRRFSIGERTVVSGAVTRRVDGGFDVSISGPALDGEALLNAAAEIGEAETGEGGAKLPPVRLQARLDRLWITADAKIDGAEIAAEYDGAAWRLVAASGRLPGNRRIEARYREGPRDRLVTLDAQDAGALLRLLGIAEDVTGGRLVLKASKVGHGDAAPWRGKLAVTDFRVAKAPTLARLLSLASLTGISDAVVGKGIRFGRLDIPFAMRSKILTISDARAVGSGIGISATGAVDLEGQTVELEGTIVPAYTLNTLIGRIPLVGRLFGGSDGGGLFAAAYSLSGPLDEPRIQVNPLTALAPGILRDLVRGLGRAGTDPDEPEPEPQE